MQNQETASCNGFNVYGLKEGTSTLEVYRQGSGRPFFIKEIRVIQRNRITNLVLSEDHLLLGVGDQKQIELDYFPTDADNAEKISWESSNKEILLLIKMVASQLSELASAESSALQRMFRHSVFAR